jgi:F-type H+-transporting ATPase subunit gamma
MSQSFERAKSRLANIQAIQPLLSALRTMSMGSWQMANKKIALLKEYEQTMDHILSEILPNLSQKTSQRDEQSKSSQNGTDTIYLIIGSERGLCGKFNISLAEKALDFIHHEEAKTYQIWAMGSRLIRELERLDVHISWRHSLPASGLTSYQEAYISTQNWLELYESYSFNKFVLVYNQLTRGAAYQFTHNQLLPFEFNFATIQTKGDEEHWPPPIIETAPKGIYNQIIQHLIAADFYQTLLKSAAAEHSARYHLMQEASENAEEIVEELTRVINAERKRKITQEMQELAVSAGLLGQ